MMGSWVASFAIVRLIMLVCSAIARAMRGAVDFVDREWDRNSKPAPSAEDPTPAWPLEFWRAPRGTTLAYNRVLSAPERALLRDAGWTRVTEAEWRAANKPRVVS